MSAAERKQENGAICRRYLQPTGIRITGRIPGWPGPAVRRTGRPAPRRRAGRGLGCGRAGRHRQNHVCS